jgi:hypothetical protein
MLPSHDQGGKKSKPKVGRWGVVWGVLGGVALLALVAALIFYTLGVFGGRTPTVAATPTVDQTSAAFAVANRFGLDMWHDNGADAYTLLTPQAQAQTTPQKLTDALTPPPNVVVVSWDLDPAHSYVYPSHGDVIGDLTVKFDNNFTKANTEFQLDQQPDGSWRVDTFNFPVP